MMRIDQERQEGDSHRNEEPQKCLEIIGCIGVADVKENAEAGIDRCLRTGLGRVAVICLVGKVPHFEAGRTTFPAGNLNRVLVEQVRAVDDVFQLLGIMQGIFDIDLQGV